MSIMERKLVIKKSQMYAWIMFIIWFPMTSIINTYSIWFNIIKIIICGYTIFKGIYKKKVEYRYLVIWAYFTILIISTYRQNNTKNLLLSMVYAVGILSIFYYFKIRPITDSIATFYPIATFYVIINAASVFFTENGITQNAWDQANYLIGGKFSVFYLSLIWLAIYLCSRKRKMRKIPITIVLAFLSILSIRTDCSTGAFCLFLVWLMLVFEKIRKVTFKPIVVICATIAFNLLLVFYNTFLQSGTAAYLVQNILHRNLNLTGRTEIYDQFFLLIGKDILWGLGYNNTLVSSSLGYLNAQNGFLDVISKCGLIGVAFFLVIYAMAILYSYHSEEKEKCLLCIWPVLIAFIIAGLVEISFNTYFFLVLSVCFSFHGQINEKNGGYNFER